MAQPNIFLRVAMFVMWLALLVISVLAYTGSMGGLTIENVAGKNKTPLTPEGYTFYSLAIIGLLEGVGCLYALTPVNYEGPRKDRWKTKTVNAVGVWWILGFLCQLLWLILWVQDQKATFIVSFCVQIAGLTSFAICYGILMGMTSKHGNKLRLAVSAPSYLFLYIPTVMNLAWLTIASCIGFLTILQEYMHSNDENIEIVATLLAAAVTFAGLLVEGFHVSVFFGLTLVWTFTGIYVKAENADYKFMEQGILVCLILLSLVTFCSIVVSIFRFCRQPDDKATPLTSSSSEEEEEEQVAPPEKSVMV